MSYEEQIMSKDKYPSIFSPQMETKMHASAESVLKSAYRKLMLRKIARTGNKICRKHLFLARKFAR